MARPREFDTDQVLERAMDLFWRQGYNATSLPQLTMELGIGSGSLYGAFGSKEGLYAQALKRYCDDQAASLVERLDSASDIRAALRETLLAMAEADLADPERGCLLVNAATERAAHEGTVERVKSTMASVESALTGALQRAQVRGELAAEKRPAELARFLTTFIQGMRVMGKAHADREFLEGAVSGALKVLD
ncbi:TetR/AcrR family transcriptional regulator [Streptomyces sp. NBC_00328]|uniref:TetR/AcrR family transcriptional regulator n=1 Tax=Streptomyces sp. NBC_00328 TaxID=2903646 RepID=UPI002E2D1157|nr:TetR/AcrR family transcriptional regulator [Streptomyces sp. NBC_00328]